MKNTLLLLSLLIAVFTTCYGQEKMEIEGAIIIKNSEDATPKAGTIRFNPSTNDFEGWNGHQWLSLTRLQESGGGVTDAQGWYYSTVKLGSQEWMAENLRTTKYKDNTPIKNVTSASEWHGLTTGAWCYYDNIGGNTVENKSYGKLYNWYAVGTGKLCPTDWHVPSKIEWKTLFDYLGGILVAGGKMKETGTSFWNNPNLHATNESGFTGLPGGYRAVNGVFHLRGYSGYFWSSTNSLSFADLYLLGDVIRDIREGGYNKKFGISVRCLKD